MEIGGDGGEPASERPLWEVTAETSWSKQDSEKKNSWRFVTGPDLQLCKARIFNVLRKLTVVPWEAHAKVKLGSQEPFGMGVAREVGIKWIQRGSLLIECIEYNLLPVLYLE